MRDEWRSIDEGNIVVDFVVQVAFGTWHKELPEEGIGLFLLRHSFRARPVDELLCVTTPLENIRIVFLGPQLCFDSGNIESFCIGGNQDRSILPITRVL